MQVNKIIFIQDNEITLILLNEVISVYGLTSYNSLCDQPVKSRIICTNLTHARVWQNHVQLHVSPLEGGPESPFRYLIFRSHRIWRPKYTSELK